jgi:LysR family transcriptional activator of nhaA
MYLLRVQALNHHHLYHFWMVVREGGVTRASEKLNVSQPTISGQLRELEEALGEKLLARSGRTVVLTDVGRTVYRYADEMLGLDRELLDAVKGRPTPPGKLAVGVAMVVPKLVAYQILEPALRLPEPIQLVCVHQRPERLLAELAIYGLDVVLADAPAPPAVRVRAYSHLLGECAVSVFGTERVAAAHRRGFPRSLDGAPFLLPSEDSALRFSLEEWFQKHRIRPRVVGTFDDSAMLDAFGQAGAGLFAMPAAIEGEVRRQYRVRVVGRLDSVRQRFYAITVERKLRNPAVIAISERARALFG